MRRLFLRSQRIKHLHPRPPQPKSQKSSKSQADDGADGNVCTDLACGAFEGIAVGVLEVVFEVVFGKGGDVLPCIFTEEGEGVGGHGLGCKEVEGRLGEGSMG